MRVGAIPDYINAIPLTCLSIFLRHIAQYDVSEWYRWCSVTISANVTAAEHLPLVHLQNTWTFFSCFGHSLLYHFYCTSSYLGDQSIAPNAAPFFQSRITFKRRGMYGLVRSAIAWGAEVTSFRVADLLDCYAWGNIFFWLMCIWRFLCIVIRKKKEKELSGRRKFPPLTKLASLIILLKVSPLFYACSV